MESLLIRTCLSVILTIIIFFGGVQFGYYSSDLIKREHIRSCSRSTKVVTVSNELISHTSCISNSIDQSLYKLSGKMNGGIFNEIFSQLHHPGAPVTTELLINLHNNITEEMKSTNPYQTCNEVYLTRTGSATSMSNKCIALSIVRDGDASPYMHGHRSGLSAKLVDRYQGDVVDSISLREERVFLPLFIKNLNNLVKSFQSKMGNPVLSNGNRKAITIMVANEGVMDLVLNFICSCRASNIEIKDNLIVFVGQPELASILEDIGIKTFYHEALGPIPKKAAGFYGDNVFGVLMWLKTTSVYLATKSGYDVLFQDTDLVWMKDPIPELQGNTSHDIVFMDDGARTPRFTPFYANSGFYFQRYNTRTLYLMEKMIKSISEIAVTHSHQATLTRHLTESHHLVNLQILILSQLDYPSGIVFHHNKEYIHKMKDYLVKPIVFHMCWTSSREEKVTYFKEIGMWFLPDNNPTCETATGMKTWLQDHPQQQQQFNRENNQNLLLEYCCQNGKYWENMPKS